MSTPYLHIPDAMTPPPVSSLPTDKDLALKPKYALDAFQQHGVAAIESSKHVFVTAKTGSGKTFLGEYLCAYNLARGRRVFYTTPIKSLSNQKFHDLKRLFPAASVGILTGDIKMCPDADIVVMTAEILRNLFYKRGTATEHVGLSAAVSLDRVGGIVMDEVHYIQDPERGHVWEESLILCPRDIQLVLLSATLPSAATLAGWLANLHARDTVLLSTTFRVVPLVHGVLTADDTCPSGWRVTPLLDAKGAWRSGPEGYTGWLAGQRALHDAAAAHKRAVAANKGPGPGTAKGPWNRADHDRAREAQATALRASKVHVETPTARLQRTVSWLATTRQLPALFFVFSRRECERLAASVPESLLDASEAADATHIFDFHLSRYRTTLETSAQFHTIRGLVQRGIAFHHSGLQPLLKEIVEILFSRGFVRVLFATETFAVGLNMPTKTVVFLELEKCGGRTGVRRPLRADEYLQMAGRAGRRGLDTQGLVLYEPLRGDPLDTASLRDMMTGALRPLESQMRFGHDFVLRLFLMRESGTDLRVAEQSYWAVQQRAARTALEEERRVAHERVAEAKMDARTERLLAEKADLEFIVATTVNARQKKARAALAAWRIAADDVWPKGQLEIAERRYTALVAARTEAAHLDAAVAEVQAAPLVSTDVQEAELTRWGFLEDGRLTPMGRAATEVNEGHPLLMPWLAFSGLMDDLAAPWIPCVLAAFVDEGRREGEGEGESEGGGLDPAVKRILSALAPQAAKWDVTLSEVWPVIVARTQAGASVPEIAAEFDLMEGNVQRGLARVANLIEEWSAVATLRSDLATLEKLASLTVARPTGDSLYLRIE